MSLQAVINRLLLDQLLFHSKMNSGLPQIATHFTMHSNLGSVSGAYEHPPCSNSKGYFIIELLQLKNICLVCWGFVLVVFLVFCFCFSAGNTLMS